MKQFESQLEQGFAMMTGQLQLMTGQLQLVSDQLRDLTDSVRQLESRPWLPCLIFGLAFFGLHIAVIGVVLVLLSKPVG